MNQLEQKTLEFMYLFQNKYFIEQDYQTVTKMVGDNISWIDMKEKKIRDDFNKVKSLLHTKSVNPAPSIDISQFHYEAKAISQDVCLVAGIIYFMDGMLSVRISAVCKNMADQMKLSQIHMSVPYTKHLDTEKLTQSFIDKKIGDMKALLKDQEKELKKKNQNLNALIQNVPGGVMCCEANEDLDLNYVSDGFLKMFGYTEEDLEQKFKKKFRPMIYQKDNEATDKDVKRQLEKGNTKRIEYRVVCKDGSLMTVMDYGQLVKQDDRAYYYCILIDMTETRKALEELRLSLERHKIILNQTTDIIFEWDIRNNSLYFSGNWEKKFGYKPIEHWEECSISQILHIHEGDIETLREISIEKLTEVTYREVEVRIEKADGTFIWCRIRVSLQKNKQGIPTKIIGVIADIDEMKKKTHLLQEQARKDTLTDLYNKGTTQSLADEKIVLATEERFCAVIIIDMDNFKQINDAYGHASGDVILTDVATILKRVFHGNEIVGRIGGDEFVVVISDVISRRQIRDKAEQLKKEFNSFLQLDQLCFSCSIGIALAPKDGHDFYSLYKKADVALYQAKAQGKNTYAFYENQMGGAFPVKEGDQAKEGRTGKKEPAVSQTIQRNWLLDYVFATLYESRNLKYALESVLEVIGNNFDVSRVYVFEDSLDGQCCSNTYEWCSKGVEPQKQNLQNLNYTEVGNYDKKFDMAGIFYCRDTSQLSDCQRHIFELQGIKSFVQCLMVNKGKRIGFIGFDDCRSSRVWTSEQIDVLSMVAKIVGTFIVKADLEAERKQK